MFNILRILVKIAYITAAILVFMRIVMKASGIKPVYSEYRGIVQPIYNITEIIITPITFLFNKLHSILPESTYGFFPIINIEQTGGTFEWSTITTLASCIILGVLLERIIFVLIDYEKAFLSISKEKPVAKNRSLERLKAESDVQSTLNKRESALKDAYNLIIKRLDREKTELVNKNISLEKELITDTLTGLKTRKYLDERLKYEFNTAKVRKQYLSVIMFDIDHFKLINDNLGHKVGDKVLQKVSKIIINACIKNVVAARYGGEEIIIICPKLSSEETANLAETIRKKIETQAIYDKEKSKSVTISAGIATYKGSETIKTPDELVEKADSALYEAKNSGRNQVKVYRF